MYRILLRNGFRCSSVLPVHLFTPDRLQNATETEKQVEPAVAVQETGWDRIKAMFRADEFGNLSHELQSVLQIGFLSMFAGAMYGGVIQSRNAYLEFMKNNEATKFRTHFEAKEKLQTTVTMGFAKGAFKWSWRLTLFTTGFVGLSTIIQVYRGEPGILEYAAGGLLSGALYKFNMGPRGWIVGGGLGCTLGLFYGLFVSAVLSLSGMTMHEVRYWQSSWKRDKNEYFRKGMKEYLEKEDYAVIKMHDIEQGEQGKDIHNLDKNVNTEKSKT